MEMTSPSPKRRKTSPDFSEQELTIRTPTRPSFISPTRASLARFNPNLLPKPRTSGAARASDAKGQSELLQKGQKALAYVLGQPSTSPSVSTRRAGGIVDEDLIVKRSIQTSPARQNARRDAVGTSVREEALERPRSNERMDFDNVAISAHRDDQNDDEDDGLPPLPADRQIHELQQDTPPRGLLWSSPSKRSRKSKSRQATETVPSSASRGEKQDTQVGSQRVVRANASPPARGRTPELEPKSTTPPVPKQKKSLVVEEIAVDPEQSAKRKEKEQLLRQLNQLQDDVRFLERIVENDRGKGTSEGITEAEMETLR